MFYVGVPLLHPSLLQGFTRHCKPRKSSVCKFSKKHLREQKSLVRECEGTRSRSPRSTFHGRSDSTSQRGGLPTLPPPQAAPNRTEGFHCEMPNVLTLQAVLSGANISPALTHCGEGEREEGGGRRKLWSPAVPLGPSVFCKAQRLYVEGLNLVAAAGLSSRWKFLRSGQQTRSTPTLVRIRWLISSNSVKATDAFSPSR